MTRGQPIDRGWSWIVCLGTGIQAFFVIGGLKTMGVLFVEILEIFEVSRTVTALTLGISAGGFAVSAMMCNVLTIMVGVRVLAVAGSVCYIIALFMASFPINVWYIIMTLGFMTGVAFGAMLTPAIILLSVYFDKRKAFANGLALAGSSIGQLVMPYLMTYLVEIYGYSGAVLLYSGIAMHCIPAAMLLRPVTFWDRRHKLQPSGTNTTDMEYSKVPVSPIQEFKIQDSRFKSIKAESDTHIPVAPQHTALMLGANAELRGSRVSVLKNAFASLVPGVSIESLDTVGKSTVQVSGNNQPELRSGRKIGSIRLRTVTTKDFFRLTFDRDLLRSPTFWLLFFALGLGHAGFMNAILHLPALGVELFNDKHKGAMLVTLAGVFDLFGRIGGGWFSDQGYMTSASIITMGFFVSGLSTVLVTFHPILPLLIVYCVLMGVFGGLYRILLPVVAIELFGRKKTGPSVGMMYMALGLLIIPVPTILGYMKESLGSYLPAYQVCGGLLFVGVMFLVILRYVQKHDPIVVKPETVCETTLDGIMNGDVTPKCERLDDSSSTAIQG